LLIGALVALLAIDLAIARGRDMTLRAAGVASAVWVAIALSFFGLLLVWGGPGDASAYLAGYLVEKTLSLDNVFVFLLVLTAFALPVGERHRLLSYGIALALVLRLVFIVVGAAALHAASWLSFVFAALLIWTGWKMFLHRNDHDGEQALVEKIRKRLPAGMKPATAALLSLVVVDLVFAVDSVPAILAITDDTFIVFAANAFALLGLRPLFFLVAKLVERLVYLKTALAALLVFIGLKMAWGELFGKVGPEFSLPIIAGILAIGVVASLLRAPDDPVADGVGGPVGEDAADEAGAAGLAGEDEELLAVDAGEDLGGGGVDSHRAGERLQRL
jgi:tellurite resistance protein TerC